MTCCARSRAGWHLARHSSLQNRLPFVGKNKGFTEDQKSNMACGHRLIISHTSHDDQRWPPGH